MKRLMLYFILFFSVTIIFPVNDFTKTNKLFNEKQYHKILKIDIDKIKSSKIKKQTFFLQILSFYKLSLYTKTFSNSLKFLHFYPTSKESEEILVLLKNSLSKIKKLNDIDLDTFRIISEKSLKKMIKNNLITELSKRGNIEEYKYFSKVFDLSKEINLLYRRNEMILNLSKNLREKKYKESEKLLNELKDKVLKNGYLFRYFIFLDALVNLGLKNNEKAKNLFKELILKYPHSKFTVPALNKLSKLCSYNEMIIIFDNLEPNLRKYPDLFFKSAFIKGRVYTDKKEYQKAEIVFENSLKIKKMKVRPRNIVNTELALLYVYKQLGEKSEMSKLKKVLNNKIKDFPFIKKMLKLYK